MIDWLIDLALVAFALAIAVITLFVVGGDQQERRIKDRDKYIGRS